MGNRLDLGCGFGKRDGFIGIDCDSRVKPDVVCDLTKGIPYPDNSTDEIWCSHFYEHLNLPDGRVLIREILRVCRPGAMVTIKVPLRFQDPSHLRILDGWWFGDFEFHVGFSKRFDIAGYSVETIHTSSTLPHELGKPFSYEQATLVMKVID